MSQVQTERVLVVPTELFHHLGAFQGFSDDVERYLDELFSREHTSYRPRAEVEEDPGFKQLIPYVIFRYADPHGRESVFQYTRGCGQGERRLHAKRSIGVGGHISADDGVGELDPYQEGMRRELDEEVAIDTPYEDRCVGLINDDETDVGRVHLGVVHIFDVRRPAVTAGEDDIVDGRFLPVEELWPDMDSFESWSQICLRALFPR